MSFKRIVGCAVLCVLAVSPGRAADTSPDIETQYLSVLEQLKKPSTSGVLVTEVDPDSEAAASGMRGGDVITEYLGAHMTSLKGLREQIADAVAAHVRDGVAGTRVLARVRRGEKDVLLSLPRAALGIRAVAVEANSPKERNPPPDRPGEITLNWQEVLDTLAADNANGHGGVSVAAFRMFERTESDASATPVRAAEESWIGWQLAATAPDGEGLAGTVDIHRIDVAAADMAVPSTERSLVSFRLRQMGDYKIAAAFELDHATTSALGDNALYTSVSAQRVGETLKVATTFSPQIQPPEGVAPNEVRTQKAPFDAIAQSAVPWVAAAMPHTANAALGMHLLSERGFVALPGYVVITRGRKAVPNDPAPATPGAPAVTVPAAEEAWEVDLMHCGVIVESYWFSEQRSLVCVQSQGTPSVILRRVPSEKEASLPMVRAMPATQSQPSNSPAAAAPVP